MNKIAVVGAGLIGVKHLKVIQQATNVDHCALVDVNPKAKAVADLYRIPFFTDLDTMLATVHPDGVIIATPNTLHMSGARACILRGIPVLVEKPFATCVDEAKVIVDLAQQNNVPVLTGYFRRYNPTVVSAKQCLDRGELGRLVSVHCHFWIYKPDDYYTVPWRTQTGGGPIQINLSHDIDLLLHLMGDINSITAISSHAIRGLAVEDTAVALCTFENGALGTLNISDTIPAPWSWELTSGDNPDFPNTQQTYCMIGGTKASLDMPRNRLWYYQDDPSWFNPISTTTIATETTQALTQQVEHFSDVISGKIAPRVTGTDGIRVMQVTNAIAQSIKSGKTIYL